MFLVDIWIPLLAAVRSRPESHLPKLGAYDRLVTETILLKVHQAHPASSDMPTTATCQHRIPSDTCHGLASKGVRPPQMLCPS